MSSGKLNEQAKGVYIIAATPFTDEGAVDLQSVDSLTDFYLGLRARRRGPGYERPARCSRSAASQFRPSKRSISSAPSSTPSRQRALTSILSGSERGT